VIINPAINIKNIILEKMHPALAIPLKVKIPAITDSNASAAAIVSNGFNIMHKIL